MILVYCCSVVNCSGSTRAADLRVAMDALTRATSEVRDVSSATVVRWDLVLGSFCSRTLRYHCELSSAAQCHLLCKNSSFTALLPLPLSK